MMIVGLVLFAAVTVLAALAVLGQIEQDKFAARSHNILDGQI